MKAIKDTVTSKWSQKQWNDLTNILPYGDQKINCIWILNSKSPESHWDHPFQYEHRLKSTSISKTWDKFSKVPTILHQKNFSDIDDWHKVGGGADPFP